MSYSHVFRANQQVASELKNSIEERVPDVAPAEVRTILGLNVLHFLEFCKSRGAEIEELSSGDDPIGLTLEKLRFNLSLGVQDPSRVLSQGGAPLDPEGAVNEDPTPVTRYNREGTFVVRMNGETFVLHVASFRFLSPTNSNMIFAFCPGPGWSRLDAHFVEFASERLRRERENGSIRVWGSGEIRPTSPPTWDDIYLPADQKQEIRMQVKTFLESESLYRRLNIPYRRGFLLFGPPGNGKTMLIKILAASYPQLKPVMVPLTKTVGERELGAAIREAERLAPSLLILEDIDVMFGGTSPLAYSEFQNLVDGVSELSRGVLIVATTNHPAKLGAALTERPGRLDRLWKLGKPNLETRRLYICRLLDSSEHGLSDAEAVASDLAKKTEGFSMAYLRELYTLGSFHAINAGKPVQEEHLQAAFEVLNEQRLEAERSFPEEKSSGFGFGAKS